jgi:hypothetical protein
MDRLPLELSILVYQHLEEFDLAPTPYSKFTEEPADRLVYGKNDFQQRAGHNNCWLKLTHTSSINVLNARLSCSTLYDASHKTFAKLLGNRTFRLTNVGFQDLILISRQKDLLPHIQSLTLGCATFRRNLGINESGFVWPSTFLSGLNLRDRSRLAAAYVQCRDWQHDNMHDNTRGLASILGAFPNLKSIRIVTVDHAVHLGGWLKPDDEDLLHRDHFLYHDRSSDALRQRLPSYPSRLYNNDSSLVRDCIVEAIKLSKLSLRDFRADPRPPLLDICEARLFGPALHTLRIAISQDDVARLDSSQWSSILGQAVGLQDLSLGLDIQCGAERAGSFWQHKRQKVPTRSAISEQLFLALQRHAQLQRVELFGGWAFSEAVITNFVDEHNDTLRCLILSDPLLFGSWQSALAAIAVAMYNKAEFIKARMPMESESIDAWP